MPLRLVLTSAALAVAFALHAWGQEREFPPAPPPAGIVRSPGQAPPPRVEAPTAAVKPAYPPRRATGEAFGERLVLEVRDLPTAEADAALRAAAAAVGEIEELTAPDGDAAGGLGALNRAAGEAAQTVDPRLAALLDRALSFCRWSRGAHGPLGGNLYRLWRLDGRPRGIPAPDQVRQAAGAASCDGLTVDAAAGTARLAPGRRLDLRGFARGFAVDQAVDELRRHGAEDLLVGIGRVWRAAGDGPDGRGWPLTLPVFPGLERPLDRLWLTDRALTVVSTVHQPLVLGGERLSPWLDQRSGRPTDGVIATVAATELAVDAEALAVALTALGNREGMLRLSGLEPTPAVLWLLGAGDGRPLEAPYRWTGFGGQ